jgi:hypothetical protein
MGQYAKLERKERGHNHGGFRGGEYFINDTDKDHFV